MAIRGAPPKPNEAQHTQKPARHEPASPLQRLMDFGSARTPSEAKKIVTELLATLRAAGFPVGKTNSAEADLGQALKLFQKENALPETGVVDKDTHAALVDAGHLDGALPSSSTDAVPGSVSTDAPAKFDVGGRRLGGGGEAGMPKGGDVPEGAKSSQAVELEQLVDKGARDKPPELDLKSFLSSLRAAGFPGAGKGAEQLKDALKKVQRAEGLAQTGQLDAKTADALVKRGVVDERVLPMTTASQSEAQAAARARSEDARSDPTARGAPHSDDASPQKGRGDVDGARAGSESGTEGGPRAVDGEPATSAPAHASAGDGAGTSKDGVAGKGDVVDPYQEGDDGNAPAGDDDVDDARRGHANIVDDAFEHPEGHWQVVSLAEQIDAGLHAIIRDDDGGAATYAWDFTLYRPGVYGKKQPAEKLFHLVVEKAGPFDALWEKARAALNDKLAAIEPDSERVAAEDFGQALRMARYR